MAVITLMTDFGTQDHYVACMKGVILQINPRVTLVDVTHNIAPQGVVEAAFVLRQIWAWFPPNTIHLAVVDPGVGTSRRILVGRYSDRVVIAPDNGLISLVHRDAQIQELRILDNRRFLAGSLSSTFHGRDIMAPVAAHLSNGMHLAELGPLTDRLEVLSLPVPQHGGDAAVTGHVIYVDHFGNLVTNISAGDVNAASGRGRSLDVYLAEQCVGPIRQTYADVGVGEPLALIGSTQMLEVAINRGDASEYFTARPGVPVRLR